MLGAFSLSPRVSDPNMHQGTCVMHVPWCMLGLLTSGLLWSWWQGICSQHSRRMHNPQFCISSKRPILTGLALQEWLHLSPNQAAHFATGYCRLLVPHMFSQIPGLIKGTSMKFPLHHCDNYISIPISVRQPWRIWANFGYIPSEACYFGGHYISELLY